jgi:uncharacterized protein (UPF0335 family)
VDDAARALTSHRSPPKPWGQCCRCEEFPWPPPPRPPPRPQTPRPASPRISSRPSSSEEEKKALSDDIRDVYAEAKGNGYDVKAMRAVVRLRKQDKDERMEYEAVLETYMHALGMI